MLFRVLMIVSLVVAFVLPSQTPPPTPPPVTPSAVRGDIAIAGSSTAGMIVQAAAEDFIEAGYTDSLTLESIGTQAGLNQFCTSGDLAFLMTARPLTEAESTECRAAEQGLLAFPLGWDAIAVLVHANDRFAQSMTLAELAALFSTADRWSDARPAWPDAFIKRLVVAPDEPVVSFFIDQVLGGDADSLAAPTVYGDYDQQPGLMIPYIADTQRAIGFLPYHLYLAAPSEAVRKVTLDGIPLTIETVQEGRYPLARPLLLYTTARILQGHPQAAAFLTYTLAHLDSIALRLSAVPPRLTDLEAAQARLTAILTGTDAESQSS